MARPSFFTAPSSSARVVGQERERPAILGSPRVEDDGAGLGYPQSAAAPQGFFYGAGELVRPHAADRGLVLGRPLGGCVWLGGVAS
jgi:hypothetical protein